MENIDRYVNDLKVIGDKVSFRHQKQKELVQELAKDPFVKDAAWEIASTDLYVEKVESILTGRVKWLFGWGIFLSALVVILLLTAVIAIACIPPTDLVDLEAGTPFVIIYIIKATSLTGLVATCCYFLSSLAKALFHEGTVALNRRQALRYGRLFVHIRRSDLTKADLESAFKSTDQFSTGFKDMTLQSVPESQLNKLVELLVGALDRKGEEDTEEEEVDGVDQSSKS